ncbi:MAG: LAGLIDADG family homing endonuclease [Candidatus Poribacteria bacterium]
MSKGQVNIDENQMSELYENHNFSVRRLAKVYNCGATTIQRKLHQHKIKVRPSMSVKLDIPKDRLRFLYTKEKKTSFQIAREYSCSNSTILNRLKEYQIKIRDISEAHIKYPKQNFRGDLIEKAYLVGFRLGDLFVKKYEKNGKIISVECGSAILDQIVLIKNLFKKYGYVRITKRDAAKVIRIQCALNDSFSFLLEKKDMIRPWILRNNRCFFSFFAGYLDAEGDLGIHSNNCAYLRVGTYDRNILSQIQSKLSDKGINAKLTLDRPKGSKVNLSKYQLHLNKAYKTNQDFWRLAVYKKRDLLKLLDWLSPFLKHQRMKDGLIRVRKNIKYRNRKYGNLRMAYGTR